MPVTEEAGQGIKRSRELGDEMLKERKAPERLKETISGA